MSSTLVDVTSHHLCGIPGIDRELPVDQMNVNVMTTECSPGKLGNFSAPENSAKHQRMFCLQYFTAVILIPGCDDMYELIG